MKAYIIVLTLLCMVAAGGCKKAQPVKQVEEVNADSISITEADSLLAQPSDVEVNQESEQVVANSVVVNDEAGPLQEAAVSEPVVVSDTPDEIMIQEALKKLGFYNGTVDGKVGPKTKKAIKEFQSKKNLPVDGKVGPKTWAVLKKALEQ